MIGSGYRRWSRCSPFVFKGGDEIDAGRGIGSERSFHRRERSIRRLGNRHLSRLIKCSDAQDLRQLEVGDIRRRKPERGVALGPCLENRQERHTDQDEKRSESEMMQHGLDKD